MSDTTREELAHIQTEIARIAMEHPNEVMLAALSVLIEVNAGNNPALRDYVKLQMYRGIRQLLHNRGLR